MGTSQLHEGLALVELMRDIGLAAILGAVVTIILVEFVCRRRMSMVAYHGLLPIGLLVFPALVLFATSARLLEETKTVDSCASCHVMGLFVNDLRDPASDTLAARHYKNKWIPTNQCYSCHTSYGLHGSMKAKQEGLRHWYLYVTRRWEEPIRFRGTYPNVNCLMCHADTPKFTAVEMHTLVATELATNQTGCISCHGPPHPQTNGGTP